MKKLGVICNYYVRNYGSVLQSFALYSFLKEHFPQTTIIACLPQPTKGQNLLNKLLVGIPYYFGNRKLLKRVTNSRNGDRLGQLKKARGEKFDTFIRQKVENLDPYADRRETAKEIGRYDRVVLGSDQLWGLSDIITDYHTLSFVPAEIPKIAYGTSFGVSALPPFFLKKASSFLKRFDAISSREIEGAQIVEKAIGKRPPVVVDPVMLLDESQWSEIAGTQRLIQEDYVFAFFMGDNMESRKTCAAFAEKHNLKTAAIQHLDEYIDYDDGFFDIKFNEASPEEFLNLIRNAKYVFTDLFHVSTFSIIFKKDFYVFYRYKTTDPLSKNSRIDSLLSRASLKERLIIEDKDMEAAMDPIDYCNAAPKMEDYVKESKEYLLKSLQ